MKILIFLILFTSASVFAFVPEKFHMELEQTIKSIISGKEKKSSGELFYLAPGSIKFNITSPKKKMLTFIKNSKGQTWYYTPARIKGEKATIRTGVDVELPLLSIITKIKAGIKTNDDFLVIKNKNHFLLQFSKTFKQKVKLQAAQLIFKNASEFQSLKKIIFTGLDGQDVRLLIKSINLKKVITKKDFEFSVI